MTNEEYIRLATRTEDNYAGAQERLQNAETVRLLHAGMGMSTEAAEIEDALKKHIYYGKPLDRINLKEELGDMLWFTAIAMDTLGLSFESVMQTNIAKLKARYGDKFSSERAITRDLKAERDVLEQ